MIERAPAVAFRAVSLTGPEDCDSIARWDADPALRHLILPQRDPNRPAPYESGAEMLEAYRTAADISGGLFERIMILVDDRPAGTGSWMIDPLHKLTAEPKTAWFGIVIGEPWARGRGVGAKVLAELERRSRAAGAIRGEVGVFEFNAVSLRFFRGQGYQEIGRLPNFTYWNGKGWMDLRLAKTF